MKKLFLIVGGLVVVVIAAAVALPFLIPTETYKAQIEAQVERATGRELEIKGPLEFSLLPSVALRTDDVRFANAPGGSAAQMAELKALEVELKVWPLLRGALEVDRFVLVEPVIHLEVDAEGRANWQIGAAGTEPAAGAGGGSSAGGGGGGGGGTLPISDVRLGEIRIENGTVTYDDARSGTSERVENVDLSLDLPDLQSPLKATGSLDYKGKTIELDLGVDQPLALVQGGASPLDLSVDSPLLQVRFTGEVSNDATPGADGGLDLAVPSIRELAAWLGQPIEFQGEGLQKLAVKGQLEGTPSSVAFTDATIALDAIEGEGEVHADLAGAVPKLSGRLDLGAVDLDPYLAPEPAPGAGGGQAAGGAQRQQGGAAGGGQGGAKAPSQPPATTTEAGGAAEGWSDEPIELPPVGGADVDFELTLDGLTMHELEIGPTVLGLAMHGNRLQAELKEFLLYDGRGSGTLEIVLEDGVPVISQDFRLEGLQALPFLRAAADFDRLEGTANAELSLTTRGNSERRLVQNLNGNGKVTFLDGAVVGINLAAMVRNAANAFLDPAAGEARKTDFAELAGTFTVTDGVVQNDDLRLQAPTLRVDGKGKVSLPKRTVNYRFEPKAAATLEGQGGERDVSGLLVPVIVKGPWDDLTYTPDLSDIARRAIEDPEALKQQLDQLGDQAGGLKDALKDMKKKGGEEALLEGLSKALGGEPQGEAPADKEQKAKPKKPEDQVQDLLKGLLRN